MPLLDDLADWLLTMPDLSLTENQLFLGVEPDATTDPALTLVPYASEPAVYVQDQLRPAVEIPRVMLTCRSRAYEQAQDLAERLYALLWQLPPPWAESVQPLETPRSLGAPDANGRYAIAFRLRVIRTT